jgi:hypothetical protein
MANRRWSWDRLISSKSPLQLLLGFVLLGDVDVCPDQLNHLALAIEDRVSNRVHMFRCSVRKPDLKIDLKIDAVADCCSADCLDDPGLILRKQAIVISRQRLIPIQRLARPPIIFPTGTRSI